MCRGLIAAGTSLARTALTIAAAGVALAGMIGVRLPLLDWHFAGGLVSELEWLACLAAAATIVVLVAALAVAAISGSRRAAPPPTEPAATNPVPPRATRGAPSVRISVAAGPVFP